jgi:protein phosphatase
MKSSSYSDIGKRELNEDFITYRPNIYVLCDGVGGADHGEVASRFVAEKLVDYFERFGDDAFYGNTFIQDILKRIQVELNDRLRSFPNEKGMGTTLAAILINHGSTYIFHIGDSRVYYIRPSERSFWCTTDHSVVSELINSGLITTEEALTHPMKNRITRAIQSNTNSKTTKAEVNFMPNIKIGDLIFLCSDGVLESLTVPLLIEILCNQELTIEEKINEVKTACLGISNDNNSALLLEVETSDEFFSSQKFEICFPSIELSKIDFLPDDKNKFFMNCSFYIDSMKNRNESRQATNKILYVLSIAIITFLILIVAGATISFFRR